MIECNAHYVRFYNVEPRAIHCLAYEESNRKLALSRSDSSIEVWDVAYAPHVQCVIPSSANDSVEALAWCEARLFSVGQLGYLREYNLQQLCPKQDHPVTTGPAWCLDISSCKSQIAVGTESGYVNIFDVTNDDVSYVKVLDRQEGRILCIAWDPTGQMVVTGGLDVIRVWSVKSGHAVRRLVAGRSDAAKETVVWCVAISKDFTIITGDSRGFVCFWDGNAGTQLDGFCSHKADVLSVCLDKEENTVYCAGVDPVIVSFTRVVLKGSNRSQWVRSVERRIHSHDVRTMVVASGGLFSAGVDGYLALSSYPPKVVYKYPPTLLPGCVQVCRGGARCVLLRYPGKLEVWRLGRPGSQGPVLVLQLCSRPGELLQCAALSPDARWLLYSTATRLRLFSLAEVEGVAPVLTKCRLEGKDSEPCHGAVFSASSQFVVLASNSGSLHVYQMSAEGAVWLRTIHTLADKVLSDVVKLLAFSDDDRYFAAGDCSSIIAVWSVSTWQVQFVLPRHRCAPTAMQFHQHRHLVVVYADHKIVEVVLKTGKYTKFSKSLSGKVPLQWTSRAFPISNIAFDPRNDNVIIFHDDNMLCVLNKDKEWGVSDAKVPRRSGVMDSSERQNVAFHFNKKFKHLVHAQWLGKDELVIVEVSPESLITKLPLTLKQKVFGM